ncbi:protein kinase domain-containing protein [Roseateles oligotrophus]|uniref:HAMP domain-containing protein n=1 Tax=Roseateles oligotrophus TaxID=1769250 RepID=A0ABT2YD19_9BURK|nr:cache domain-containing protein [Roseateles oligotrophus]MCV2367937.1 HAMP domain-containing protein [Roseateles oligotrophus]
MGAQPSSGEPADDDADRTVIRPRSGTADPDATVVLPSPAPQDDATVIIRPRLATQIAALGPAVDARRAGSNFPPLPPLPKGHAIALPVGFRLHEYRIDAVLGQGGFGITYLATDVHLDALTAVKEYLPEEIAFRSSTHGVSPNASVHRERYRQGLENFLVEARTLASFRHPNIVRVARFFEAHDTAYMVLEYERGESLKSWWPRHQTLGERQLARLLLPLLDGLSVVHAAGFLHRDIKPDNLQLRKADGRLVLLDFGSAARTLTLSDQDAVVVTPGYAPIEQYGLGEQGPWTDIYALGATLYWMISGKRPPDAESRWMLAQAAQSMGQAIAQSGRTAMPSAQDLGRGRFSDSFLQAVDWALTPDPKGRPRDVAEWQARLFAAELHSLSLRDALRSGEVLQGGKEAAQALARGPHQGLLGLRRWLRRLFNPAGWPLAVKIALAMVVTALAPMLITGLYNLNSSLDAVSSSELRNLEQLARSTAGRMAQLIGDSQHLARSLGTDEDFERFMNGPDAEQQQTLTRKLNRLAAANRDIHLIMLMDRQGLVRVSSEAPLVGRNFGFREYFKSALRGQPFATGIVVGAAAGAPGMFYAEPVLDQSRAVIGVVVLRLHAASFGRILDQVQDGERRVGMLIDGDGVLIQHPRPELLYRSLAPLKADVLAEIQADQRFRRDSIDSLGMPLLAKAIAEHKTGHVELAEGLSQRAEIAGFAPVQGHDWTVIVSEDRALFEAPLQRLFVHLSLSVLLVGLLFLGLALLFSRSIVRPIHALTRAAEALQQGDFERASVTVRAQDEIGRLARTFNVMIDVLRQREREREREQEQKVEAVDER